MATIHRFSESNHNTRVAGGWQFEETNPDAYTSCWQIYGFPKNCCEDCAGDDLITPLHGEKRMTYSRDVNPLQRAVCCVVFTALSASLVGAGALPCLCLCCHDCNYRDTNEFWLNAHNECWKGQEQTLAVIQENTLNPPVYNPEIPVPDTRDDSGTGSDPVVTQPLQTILEST